MPDRERRKRNEGEEDRVNRAPAPEKSPAEQPIAPIPAATATGRGSGSLRADAALNLQRTQGNRATRRLLGLPPTSAVQREGDGATTGTAPRAAAPTAATTMTRAEFERRMGQFGVGNVRTGTLADQRARLNSLNPANHLGDHLDQAAWHEWNPGSSSTLYNWIVDTFTTFASRTGGLPEVREVVFYETDYQATPAAGGTVVASPVAGVGAEYSGGSLVVYRAGAEGGGRRWATGRNPGPGATDQAAVSSGTQEQATSRTIAHELGHGIQEAALTPRGSGPPIDPGLMRDYTRIAGWHNGVLYDAGVPEVGRAIAAGNAPAERYRITADNWNRGDLVEQPISRYMTASPFEDFPEAVAAFVTDPSLLQARSPQRFQFIQAHMAILAPHLRRPGGQT